MTNNHYDVILPDAPGAYLHYFTYVRGDQLHWRISTLYVPSFLRRQGIATRLMEALTERADKAGAVVNITAEPEQRSLNINDLKRFYERFGFIQISEQLCGYKNYMERAPKT